MVKLTPAENLSENSSVCVEMFNAEDAASISEELSTQAGNDNYAVLRKLYRMQLIMEVSLSMFF